MNVRKSTLINTHENKILVKSTTENSMRRFLGTYNHHSKSDLCKECDDTNSLHVRKSYK